MSIAEVTKSDWVYHAPCGVYKNEKLSKSLRQYAKDTCPLLVLTNVSAIWDKQTARVTTGEVIQDTSLQECDGIKESPLIKKVTVKEWGRAIPYSCLTEDFKDFYTPECQALANLTQLCYTDMLTSALRSTKTKRVPRTDKKGEKTHAVYSVDDINDLWEPRFQGWLGKKLGKYNRKMTVATRPIEVSDIVYAMDVMGLGKDPSRPMYLVATGAVLARLSADKEWQPWHSYTIGSSRLPGEAGKFHGVICLRASNNRTYKGTGDEAFLVAGSPLCTFIYQDMEARAGIPSDYGRYKAVAMYGVMATQLCDVYERVIHLCGAPRPTPLYANVIDYLVKKARILSWKVRRAWARFHDDIEPEAPEEYYD